MHKNGERKIVISIHKVTWMTVKICYNFALVTSNRVTEHCPPPLFNCKTFLGEDSNLSNFIEDKKNLGSNFNKKINILTLIQPLIRSLSFPLL